MISHIVLVLSLLTLLTDKYGTKCICHLLQHWRWQKCHSSNWRLDTTTSYYTKYIKSSYRLRKRKQLMALTNIVFNSFEVGLSSSETHCVIHFNESPLRKMKNTFYLTLKALFAYKILKFFSWIFGHAQKTAWLERHG